MVFPKLTPSSGTLSPFFITIILPTLTTSGDTFSIFSPVFKLANSGLKSSVFSIFFFEFSTALSCKYSPILYKSNTRIASLYSPIAKAPIVATHIKKFSSNISFLNSFLQAFQIISYPSKTYDAAYNINEK